MFAPGEPMNTGSRHPVSIIMNKIVQTFSRIGFTVAQDREIEDDWHNFTALNTPEDHPARDMQDTYYLLHDTERLLRTHTSSVQIRTMEKQRLNILQRKYSVIRLKLDFALLSSHLQNLVRKWIFPVLYVVVMDAMFANTPIG